MNTKFETNTTFEQLDLRSRSVAKPADLTVLEQYVLQLWKELSLKELVMAKNRGNPPFSFFDGPVTANNPLGVHHAWGRTLKDVVQRFKSLQGYDQRFEYGFDTQGLWVEVEVEKSLGFNSKQDLESFGVDRFVEACKERVETYSEVQNLQSDRLAMLQAPNNYFTHSDDNISAIWHVLKVMHNRGWLYKGERPMPWCPRCGTSLSAHEQADAYKEVEHTTVYAKFPVLHQKHTSLLVWTTTPWTLPANMAVAVHPDKTYGLFEKDGDRLLAGVWLADTLLVKYRLVKEVKGRDLIGYTYTSPFYYLPQQTSNSYEVVAWTQVDEEGTGVVHLAPGCGLEDFDLLPDYKPLSPLQEDGTFCNGFGPFSGLHYQMVNDEVVELLRQRGLLFKTKEYRHRYPHCWRCKTELVYRLVDEWFLKMDELRPLLREAAELVNWDPDYTKKLFLDWVNNMGDWCISRRRYWGLPLPFYVCDCGHLTVVESKEQFLANAVGDASQVQELHLPWVDKVKYPCESCQQPVSRVTAVGDCWLDAGVMPFSTLDYFSDPSFWRYWFPADFVCEMREQVRLWFYSMMTLSVSLTGQPPFKQVLSYEKVKDKNNREMHKSGKNNVLLDDALDRLGSDVLRLYYLVQNRSSNMRFDYEVGELQFSLLQTVAHCLKFFMSYADLFHFKFQPLGFTNMHNRWMMSQLTGYKVKYQQALDRFRFSDAVTVMRDLVDDLSGWYLRQVRELVWQDGPETKETLTCLYTVLKHTSVLFAPLTPVFAEVMYQNLSRYGTNSSSVHLEDYTLLDSLDVDLANLVDQLQIFDNLNKQLRNSVGMKLRQPLRKALLWSSNDPKWDHDLLCDLLNVKEVVFMENPQKYLDVQLKPNYAVLGPKLGNGLPLVVKELNQLPQEVVSDFVLQDHPSLQLEELTLERSDLEVRFHPRDELVMATQKKSILMLDVELDQDLTYEGWLRDLTRHLQMSRKSLALKLDQEVDLVVEGSESLLKYLQDRGKSLFDAVLVKRFSVSEGQLSQKFDHDLGRISYQMTV